MLVYWSAACCKKVPKKRETPIKIKYLINNENVKISSLNKTLEIEDSKIKPIIKKLADEGLVNIKNKKLIEISS